MKVLVLGGTGVMGKSVIEILGKQGDLVYVTSRQEHNDENNVRYLKGDAKDLAFLNNIFSEYGGFDAIVDFMRYSPNEFEEKIGGILHYTDQYVYMSSARVYGDRDGIITETTPRLTEVILDSEYIASSEYAIAKIRQEDILHRYTEKNWTIIRPYITYSEKRLQLGSYEMHQWLARILRGKTLSFPEELLKKRTSLTSGEDVAQIITGLLGKKAARGEVFTISTNQVVTWQDVLDTYLSTMRNANIACSVQFRAAVDLGLTEKYQYKYDRCYHRQFDCSKALSVCEYTDFQFKPIESGLNHYLGKVLQLKKTWEHDYRFEGNQDRLQKVLEPINSMPSLRQVVDYYRYRFTNPQLHF